MKGIWVGKTTTNDEHIILTVAGKVTCRTVRRMPKGNRHDKELLLTVCDEPWKERIAHMPRSLVMDSGKGKVVPTPIEGVSAEAEGAPAGVAPSGAEEPSGADPGPEVPAGQSPQVQALENQPPAGQPGPGGPPGGSAEAS